MTHAAPRSTATLVARLVLVGSLVFGLWLGWRTLGLAQDALFLTLEGQTAPGTVTAMQTDRVTVSYRVDRVTYSRDFQTKTAVILGDPVEVTFLPADPILATLDPQGLGRMAGLVTGAAALAVLAGLVGLWRMRGR